MFYFPARSVLSGCKSLVCKSLENFAIPAGALISTVTAVGFASESLH